MSTIQSPESVCIGWLSGVNPELELETFQEALNHVPGTEDIAVEATIKQVRNGDEKPLWKD